MADQRKNKPKLLITGGLGFIFSHVTEYFVKKGWNVTVVDNLSEGSHPVIIDGSFTFIECDVSEDCTYSVSKPTIESVIASGDYDYIIHAAAISDVDYSIKHPFETIRKNTMGNLRVFSALWNMIESRKQSGKKMKLKKFIYVSTDEVYGECEYKKTESDIIFPKNPYSCSKATGSLMRLAFDNSYKELKDLTAETRFCNVVGERQDARKIMPALIKAIKEDIPVPLHNGGKGFREYIYVGNIPPVMDLILRKGNRTYNVTLNDGLNVQQLIKKVEKITGKKIKTIPSNRPGMDAKYQMSNKRIKALGWKPKYTLEQGLRKYLKSEGII